MQVHVSRNRCAAKRRMVGLPIVAGVATAFLGAPPAQAAPQTWDGGAGTNVLNSAANWTNDALPTAAGDTATWDGTVPGDLSLVWNANFGPTSGNAGGVNINVAATNTGALQLDRDAAVSTGAFGVGDITINSGAGAFTFGDGSGTAPVIIRDPSTVFTNDSSNTATIETDVAFANGGGPGNRNITFAGSGNWLVKGSVVPATGFTSNGSAFITKNGAGTLTLQGANFYGGTTVINAGAISAQNNAALGTGGVRLASGTPGRLQLAGDVTLPNNIQTNGATFASNTNGSIENVSGSNTLNGNITWDQTGGLFSSIASLADTLTVNGNVTTAGSVTGARTLNLTGAGSTVVSGSISNGTATLGLAKNGTGTATVAGTNSYTGPTTVSAGTLLVTGSLGATAVSVSSGGTLGGTGSIAGDVTVDPSGNLAPGISPGGLGTGSLTLAGGSNLLAELNGTTPGSGYDQLNVTGTANLSGVNGDASGANLLASLGYVPTLGDALVLINNDDLDSVSGTFANLAQGSTIDLVSSADSQTYRFAIDYDGGTGNDVVLTNVVVPEPASVAALGVAGLALFSRRRRSARVTAPRKNS